MTGRCGFTAEQKRIWLEALRSGKYTPTTKVLRRVTPGGKVVGHCCLGVACEVIGPGLEELPGATVSYVVGTRGVQQEYWVPGLVGRLPGVGSGGFFDDDDRRNGPTRACIQKAVRMNDRGATFEQIADHLEANLPVMPEDA